jgi:hypothetical protein
MARKELNLPPFTCAIPPEAVGLAPTQPLVGKAARGGWAGPAWTVSGRDCSAWARPARLLADGLLRDGGSGFGRMAAVVGADAEIARVSSVAAIGVANDLHGGWCLSVARIAAAAAQPEIAAPSTRGPAKASPASTSGGDGLMSTQGSASTRIGLL